MNTYSLQYVLSFLCFVEVLVHMEESSIPYIKSKCSLLFTLAYMDLPLHIEPVQYNQSSCQS